MLLFTSGAILMTACTEDSPSPTLPPTQVDEPAQEVEIDETTEEGPSSRIVYISDDSYIYMADPHGLNQRQMTSVPGFYTWPNWSPDGKDFVFSAILEDPLEVDILGLFIMNMEDDEAESIYTNLPMLSPSVAPGLLHYPMRSPDSQNLVFVARTPTSQYVYFIRPQGGAIPQYITDGARLYSSWSPSSRYLLLHVELEHLIGDFMFGIAAAGGIQYLNDPTLSEGLYRAFHRFMHDYSSNHADRLKSHALVPANEVEWAVAEVKFLA